MIKKASFLGFNIFLIVIMATVFCTGRNVIIEAKADELGASRAKQIRIDDTGGYYNSTTVEGALQEVGNTGVFNGITTSILTVNSITGNGISSNALELVNDNSAPGNTVYYGTNSTGVKGFFAVPQTSSAGNGNATHKPIQLGNGTNFDYNPYIYVVPGIVWLGQEEGDIVKISQLYSDTQHLDSLLYFNYNFYHGPSVAGLGNAKQYFGFYNYFGLTSKTLVLPWVNGGSIYSLNLANATDDLNSFDTFTPIYINISGADSGDYSYWGIGEGSSPNVAAPHGIKFMAGVRNENATTVELPPSYLDFTAINTVNVNNVNATGNFVIGGDTYTQDDFAGFGGGSMVYPDAGIALSNGTAWTTSIVNNSSKWDIAYGWGNHANAGYVNANNTVFGYNASANTTNNAVAFGDNTSASGYGSVAVGIFAQASGGSSIGIGNNSNSSGIYGLSLGISSKASAYGVATGGSSNAASSGSVSIGYQSVSSGLMATAVGYQSSASGAGSSSLGLSSSSSGAESIAIGSSSKSSGNYSIATGSSSNASGDSAVALGRSTKSFGVSSLALGDTANAVGKYSSAIGYNAKSVSYGSASVGMYTNDSGNSTDSVATDPAFLVGNGTSTGARSNAFAVLKNGNATIGAYLGVNSGASNNTAACWVGTQLGHCTVNNSTACGCTL